MLASGKMTSNKALGNKNGKMGPTTKDNIRVGRSKAKELSFGATIARTKDNSYRTTFTVKANTCGKTEEYTKENGTTTKCTEKVYSAGLMDVDTMENTRTTRSMVLGYLLSEMDGYTKENGRMGSNTDVGYTVRRKSVEKGYGRTEYGSDGWMINKMKVKINKLLYDYLLIFITVHHLLLLCFYGIHIISIDIL